MREDRFVRVGWRSLKIIWRSDPLKFSAYGIFGILHGISWVLEVVFTQRFFDAVQAMSDGHADMQRCFFCLAGMIFSVAFDQIMNGVDNCYGKIFELAFSGYINRQVFARIDRMHCQEFEDKNRLDEIEKAKTGGEKLFWVGMTFVDLLCFYGTYFVLSGVYWSTLKPLLCLGLLAAFIPSVISRSVQMHTFEALEEKSAPIGRRTAYYESCAADIRETRLLGANGYFRTRFTECLRQLNHLLVRTQIKKQSVSLLLDGITALGYGAVLYLLFQGVLQKEISVGAFAAVLASLTRMFNFMSEAVTERYSLAVEDSAAAANLLRFLGENENKEPRSTRPDHGELVLRDVSFRYPAAETDALYNINLAIHSGETVALVGENGSGKTTLCRLLLGLYPPTAGSVSLNGRPLHKMDTQNTSAVFQNYCRYKMTLGDNVCVADMEKAADEDAVAALCQTAGVDLEDPVLCGGIHTMLGREFDGTEISGGQWQRVAIARGLYRSAGFIVLDEPTSAIDPLEETELYREFQTLCRGKTAVIVTHRLGSAKIADRILVLKNGRIVEEGTHTALLRLQGEYSRMYAAQSRWYT